MIKSPWDAIRFVFQWETCSVKLLRRLVHKTDKTCKTNNKLKASITTGPQERGAASCSRYRCQS